MIILAVWEDIYKQPFLYEVFSEDSDPDLILNDFASAKAHFNREVLTRTYNGLHFNDGTSVFLLKLPVNPSVTQPQPLQQKVANEEIRKPKRARIPRTRT
jgi:hypothetical protein